MIPHQQLHDDLRGEFRGRLHTDLPTRAIFASDASPFHVLPHAVAEPLDEADLVFLVKYAYEHSLPIIPRGAGTGLSGEALGPGVVVDLSPHFRKTLAVQPGSVLADVGFTLGEVNAALKPHGQRFAPNPASYRTCTIGGILATNASGANAFKHGYTRDYVLALRTIWDDGEIALLQQPTAESREDGPRFLEIRTQTTALLAANRALVQLTRPQTAFNRCGYVLHDVFTPHGIDFTKLMVGSEGTLGIHTQAVLATIPLAGGTAGAVLGFQSLSEALRAGLRLRSTDGIVSCDLLDQRMIALGRVGAGLATALIPLEIAVVLLLTVEGDSPAAAEAQLAAAIEICKSSYPTAVLAGPTAKPEEVAAVHELRDAIVGSVYALGGSRPTPFIEDIAVPGEELPRFVNSVSEILRRNGAAASILVHVLSGQVHFRPLIDMNDALDRARMWPIAEAVHNLALKIGGTVSTQHGTGITRTPWVEKQYGPLMPMFRELKGIFDPKGILNPGKIIGPDPSRPAWPLRPLVSKPKAESASTMVAEPVQTLPLVQWASSAEVEATKCNQCGDCRSRESPMRMCPVFHASGEERASPRAKAALILASAGTASDALAEDFARSIADQCVNCKMCVSECHSHVNIPKLALQVKAAHAAENGLPRKQWVLARLESLADFAGSTSFLTNRLLANRPFRWLLEKFFGLSRKRRLPWFQARTFMRWAKKQGLTNPCAAEVSRKVLYFVDLFANRNDPTIGMATVRVLQHHDISVYVPKRQQASGLDAFTLGDLDFAVEVAERNVRILADAVRAGYTIVCSEPAAVIALTQDYLHVLRSEDAALVAENTVELTEYLWALHEACELKLDFPTPPVWSLGHHVPCHVKALGGPIAGPKLLNLIPGLQVSVVDKSCSGMAGPYGLGARNYEPSLRAGEPMLAELRGPAVRYGSTECSACRLQMQEGTGKRTLHPIQYLAWAYGLMPELEALLSAPLRDRVSW